MSGNIRDEPPATGLPQNQSEWKASVEKMGLTDMINDTGIQTLRELNKTSGSRITFRPYLALRSVWRQYPANKFTVSKWISQDAIDTAKTSLSGRSGWKQYIKRVEEKGRSGPQMPLDDLGAFTLVHFTQAQVFDLPGETNNETQKIFSSPGKIGYSLGGQSNPYPISETPTRPQTRSTTAQLNPQMAALNLNESPPQKSLSQESPPKGSTPHFQGKGKQPEFSTPVKRSPSEPSPLETVSPLNPDWNLPASKESIVNNALVNFLNGILTSQLGVRAHWSPEQRVFKILDLLEARTDGLLKHKQHDLPLAIIEVKPYVRNYKLSNVRMQESAQIASWIAHHPTSGEARYANKMDLW